MPWPSFRNTAIPHHACKGCALDAHPVTQPTHQRPTHPQDCSPGYNTYSYSKATSERLAYQLAGQQQQQELTHTQQEQQKAGNAHDAVTQEGPRGGGAAAAAAAGGAVAAAATAAAVAAAAAAGGAVAAAASQKGEQGPRWSLATVNPGVVFGPVRVAAHARSSPGMVKVRLQDGIITVYR